MKHLTCVNALEFNEAIDVFHASDEFRNEDETPEDDQSIRLRRVWRRFDGEVVAKEIVEQQPYQIVTVYYLHPRYLRYL